MGKPKMINEVAIARTGTVHPWPGLEIITETKQPWYIRAAIWTGVIMAAPEKPSGWQISPAVITLALVIAGMVASGGYYMGLKDAENRQILERLQKAENDARIAKDLGLAKSGEVGHENSNTEKKK